VTVNRALLGRGSESDVTLNDDRVSRRHALLWREAGVVYLRDLGSSNGTRVNGRRVSGDPVEVAWGSTLDLGGLTLRLEEG
jgi:pSer/pThr/pTyr-binding forkhead associated (FHA) protein